MMSSVNHQGLPNPNSKMPPRKITNGEGDDVNDARANASKNKVQMQSVANPSALVSTQSSGFHPSVLAS